MLSFSEGERYCPVFHKDRKSHLTENQHFVLKGFVYFLKVLSSKLEDFGPDSPHCVFLATSLLRELANLLR